MISCKPILFPTSGLSERIPYSSLSASEKSAQLRLRFSSAYLLPNFITSSLSTVTAGRLLLISSSNDDILRQVLYMLSSKMLFAAFLCAPTNFSLLLSGGALSNFVCDSAVISSVKQQLFSTSFFIALP